MSAELISSHEPFVSVESIELEHPRLDFEQLSQDFNTALNGSVATRERMVDHKNTHDEILSAWARFLIFNQNDAMKALTGPQKLREQLVNTTDHTRLTIQQKQTTVAFILEQTTGLESEIATAEAAKQTAEAARAEAAKLAARESTKQAVPGSTIVAPQDPEVTHTGGYEAEALAHEKTRDERQTFITRMRLVIQDLVTDKNILEGEIDGLTEYFSQQLGELNEVSAHCKELEIAVDLPKLQAILRVMTEEYVAPPAKVSDLFNQAVSGRNLNNSGRGA